MPEFGDGLGRVENCLRETVSEKDPAYEKNLSRVDTSVENGSICIRQRNRQ